MKTVKAFNFFSSLGSERKGMKFSAFIGGSEGNTEKKCINWFYFFDKVQKFQPNPLSANPAEWSKTLKQFSGKSQRIVLVCLTILWSCCLKS